MQIIEFSYDERTTAEHFYSHHEVAEFQADNHAAQDDAVEARATEALDMENVHDCRDTFEACRAAVRTMNHVHVLFCSTRTEHIDVQFYVFYVLHVFARMQRKREEKGHYAK